MGSMCKSLSSQAEITAEEISLTPQKKLKKEKLNDQPTMACIANNVRCFYIIYPKKEDNQAQLLSQLQELNKNNDYQIEECQQLEEEFSSKNIESYFNINGLSYGSFKVIQAISEVDPQ